MATDSNTLLDEAKCLGCASNSSASDLLKLGILGRISSAYSAVQSFISRAGITDSVQIAAVSALAESAVAHGWWGKCDLIYPFVGGNATAHAQNLKSSSFTITWNGTVTHNANGITGDGATGYGDTGYLPETNGQVSLNSVHASVYRRNLGADSQVYCGCRQAANRRIQILGGFGGVVQCFLNHGGNGISNGQLGLTIGSRTSNLAVSIFSGGLTQFSSASINTVGFSFYICASNTLGAAINFQSGSIAGVTLGSGLSAAECQLMAADWQTFQTALGRQV